MIFITGFYISSNRYLNPKLKDYNNYKVELKKAKAIMTNHNDLSALIASRQLN